MITFKEKLVQTVLGNSILYEADIYVTRPTDKDSRFPIMKTDWFLVFWFFNVVFT